MITGLVARTYGLYDEVAISPAEVSFTPSVESALDRFLGRLAPVADVAARDVLMALAFAEAPGLPAELWRLAARALTGADIDTAQLVKFARGSVANFLVESAGESATAVFRLFHQALSDALSAERGEPSRASNQRSGAHQGVRWLRCPNRVGPRACLLVPISARTCGARRDDRRAACRH
ncbi:MAG: hypothetical protein ACRDQU_22915 [Pseudonocardiaceae bacterium]